MQSIDGISLIQDSVQNVGSECFQTLEKNDILFISDEVFVIAPRKAFLYSKSLWFTVNAASFIQQPIAHDIIKSSLYFLTWSFIKVLNLFDSKPTDESINVKKVKILINEKECYRYIIRTTTR